MNSTNTSKAHTPIPQKIIETQRSRIAKKGIRADDIRHEGLLTENEIAFIDTAKVYEWVKTGNWTKRDFDKWLRVIKVID